MSSFFHPSVCDGGLAVIANQDISATLTLSRPTSLSDATLDEAEGGKRVSDVKVILAAEMAIEDYDSGRVIAMPHLVFAMNKDVYQGYLYLNIYNAESLLFSSSIDQEGTTLAGESLEIYKLKIGFK